MFKFLLAVFALLSATHSYAQLLDPSKNIFSSDPFFNSAFIQQHKIKSISGEQQYKRDNQVIHNKEVTIHYEFDQKGRLTRQFSTFKKFGGLSDTVMISYTYDEKSRIIVKRTSDSFGFYSLNYEYNDKDNIVKETYCRDINANYFQSNFLLEKQYPIAIESYEYEYANPSQYKKKFLNNLGSSYKEIIVNKNENDQVVEEYGRFVITSKVEKLTFTYDAQKRIVERADFSNVSGENEILLKYRYDGAGNLLETQKSKNGQLAVRTEFLYSETPSFISAQLSLDLKAKTIDITKYSYEFY